ncbi:caspase, EACC1-associated type [Amycolatopsis sp. NPDC003865]
MRLPVPDASRAVLIGTTTFSGDLSASPLEGTRNNVLDLAEALAHPQFGGFRRENCTRLLDERDPRAILRVLDENADLATDVLLVYLAGHALPKDPAGNELFLCLPGTNPAERHWWHDALSFSDVSDVVRNSPAANRIIIVDSCFAGLVLPDAMSPDAVYQVAGAYTLTSVGPNMRAVAPSGARHTAFSGALVRLLAEGVPGHHDLLTLPRIFPLLKSELVANGFPAPHQIAADTADQLAVVRNRAGTTRTTISPHLVKLADSPVTTDRLTAVEELAGLSLNDEHVRSEVRSALVRLAGDDSRMVSSAARRRLEAIDGVMPRPLHLTLRPAVTPSARPIDAFTNRRWMAAGATFGLLGALAMLLLGATAGQVATTGVVTAILSYVTAAVVSVLAAAPERNPR